MRPFVCSSDRHTCPWGGLASSGMIPALTTEATMTRAVVIGWVTLVPMLLGAGQPVVKSAAAAPNLDCALQRSRWLDRGRRRVLGRLVAEANGLAVQRHLGGQNPGRTAHRCDDRQQYGRRSGGSRRARTRGAGGAFRTDRWWSQGCLRDRSATSRRGGTSATGRGMRTFVAPAPSWEAWPANTR